MPVRKVAIPRDSIRVLKTLETQKTRGGFTRASSFSPENKHAFGDNNTEEEGRGDEIGMPLDEYVREISEFDVVLSANSLDDLDTKVNVMTYGVWV